MTKALDIILIVVLLADIAVQLLRRRAARAACAAHDVEPPLYDDGPDGREPWQGKAR